MLIISWLTWSEWKVLEVCIRWVPLVSSRSFFLAGLTADWLCVVMVMRGPRERAGPWGGSSGIKGSVYDGGQIPPVLWPHTLWAEAFSSSVTRYDEWLWRLPCELTRPDRAGFCPVVRARLPAWTMEVEVGSCWHLRLLLVLCFMTLRSSAIETGKTSPIGPFGPAWKLKFYNKINNKLKFWTWTKNLIMEYSN